MVFVTIIPRKKQSQENKIALKLMSHVLAKVNTNVQYKLSNCSSLNNDTLDLEADDL